MIAEFELTRTILKTAAVRKPRETCGLVEKPEAKRASLFELPP